MPLTYVEGKIIRGHGISETEIDVEVCGRADRHDALVYGMRAFFFNKTSGRHEEIQLTDDEIEMFADEITCEAEIARWERRDY